MRPEVEFQLWVQQPLDQVMEQVEIDAEQFGIKSDELNRAVLNWVTERLATGPVPEWLLEDLKEE